MDTLIHVFPGLFHLVGSIPKSSQLQHLHISWPNLQFHLVNSPFSVDSVGSLLFLGTKVNSTLQLVTSQFFMVKPAVFGSSPKPLGATLHIIAPAVGPPGRPMGKTPPGEKMDQKLTGKIMWKWAE